MGINFSLLLIYSLSFDWFGDLYYSSEINKL